MSGAREGSCSAISSAMLEMLCDHKRCSHTALCRDVVAAVLPVPVAATSATIVNDAVKIFSITWHSTFKVTTRTCDHSFVNY